MTVRRAETLERKRNKLGFHEIGKADKVPIYVCDEKASASQSRDRIARAGLALPAYQFILPVFSSDISLRTKFNDNGKTDYSFWIAGIGRDTNHLIDESQESEITPAQEAEAIRLAESGMHYRDIAKKLGVTALSVYYALKKKGKTKVRKSIKPRSSALCTFDKKGNLVVHKGDSLENTVRVSRGAEDSPLLFFVLRDSYSRIGGARFVIAGCNGKQFTPDTKARVMVGVPKRPTQSSL
jgi:DNA-binding CsgD family transcriptional regulator